MENTINKRNKIIISYFIYLIYIVTIIPLINQNSITQLLSYLLGAYFIVATTKKIFIKNTNIKLMLSILEVILLFAAYNIDTTGNSQILFGAFIADLFIELDLKKSVVLSIITMVSIFSMDIITMTFINSDDAMNFLLIKIMWYAIAFAAIIIIRSQIIKNQNYKKLIDIERKQSKEIKELAIYKERTRISGEIHDTVGHKLTGALMQIQASIVLIDKDINASKEKLQIAANQIKEGISQIRISVKNIKTGIDTLDINDYLESLLKEMEKEMNVKIFRNINIDNNINSILKKVMENALFELVTNGIKHGKSTQFYIDIESNQKRIDFRYRDLGIGSNKVLEGFGLSNIKESVSGVGGTFKYNSTIDNGFSAIITMPRS